MGAMAVAIGYALKAQPLRCSPLFQWVLRPISWAERRLQAPFPSIPSPFYPPPWPFRTLFRRLRSLFRRFRTPFCRFRFSGRVTSGIKSASHALLAPDV